MGFHFMQQLNVRKTGFGNTCMAELGIPTPIASELLAGSKLVGFDQHPYVAKSGYGNRDGSDYPEQAVASCTGAIVTHYNGLTRTPMSVDYSNNPAFWGLPGQDDRDGLVIDEAKVWVNTNLTEVSFEVDYDSTAYVAYDLSRVAFQWVKVEKDGQTYELKNVACLPMSSWRNAVATFRMWGQTYSWGSEDEKFLTVPFTTVRKV